LLSALTLAACNKDVTAPVDLNPTLDEAANLGFSASFAGDPSGNFLPPLYRLPDNLKLTNEQGAKIKALVAAFEAATKADHEALAAIDRAAKAARAAGKSEAEIKLILAAGDAIRQRLAAAEKKLHDDIFALLTAEQKAWLEANKPQPCTAAPLSDTQKSQISALIAAYEQANKADLDAIKAALQKAADAKRSGATDAAIKAILETVRAAQERVRKAETALQAAITAVLTPEQQKCGYKSFGPSSAGGPGGHK
jgi:Spy/CpxP family protein refolding chaperone